MARLLGCQAPRVGAGPGANGGEPGAKGGEAS